VPRDHLLDVARVHVDPVRDDQVLLAIDEVQEPVLVDVAEVAGVQPAVDDRGGRRVWLAVVAGHEERAAPDDLADLARRQLAATLADDAQLVEVRRRTDRVELGCKVLAIEDRHEALGEPVQIVQRARRELAQPQLVLVRQPGLARAGIARVLGDDGRLPRPVSVDENGRGAARRRVRRDRTGCARWRLAVLVDERAAVLDPVGRLLR